jgi:hypothetical protein
VDVAIHFNLAHMLSMLGAIFPLPPQTFSQYESLKHKDITVTFNVC